MPITKLLLAALVAALLGACADSRDVVRNTLARRGATLDRNMLEVIPCLSDAIRTTHGVSPKTFPSNARPQIVDHQFVKYVLEVNLTPADAGVPADAARKVVYELFDGKKTGTGVRYGVEADGATQEAWWDQAFEPLAACGAVRR